MLPDPVQTELATGREATLPELPTAPAVAPPSRQHRWISSLLKPAIKLWLQSQLDAVETLTIELEAADRQLLSGCIPQVALTAQQAVYQGLHLSHIAVTGRDIQVNMGQVLKGKPLRLLHPVPVAVNLHLRESDLNRSLGAPLLAGAVGDLLGQWLQSAHVVGLKGHLDTRQSPQIALATDRLTLTAPWVAEAGNVGTLTLSSGLRLAGHRCLQFQQPELTYRPATAIGANGGPRSEPQGKTLADFALDLGTDVELTVLQIQASQLHCQGYIWVNP